MKKQASTTHFFYQNGKLVTVNQGGQQRAIFRTADMPLAEQQSDGTNGLLATDRSNSVLAVRDGEEESGHSFTAYGHDPTLQLTGALLGFNGEVFELTTTCYQLGNGYRAYSPALMRFHSPDSWSPFGSGGLNAYCYCESDPVNSTDPSGHMPSFLLNGQTSRVNRSAPVDTLNSLRPSPPTMTTSLNSVVNGNLPAPPYGAPTAEISLPGTITSQVHTAPTATTIGTFSQAKQTAVARPNQPLLSTPIQSDSSHTSSGYAAPRMPTQPRNTNTSNANSAPPSRDSTPPGSRSPSPTRDSYMPYHVQVRSESRIHPNYSRRSDPF